MSLFHGVLSTPLTPFGEDGQLQLDLVEPFVRFQAQAGISGFFCLGSWGGFPLLTVAERKRVAAAYCRAAQGHGLKIIVNVTALSLQETCELAQHAEDQGAHAVASLIPLYYSTAGLYSLDNYKAHFETLKRSVEVPVLLYNNPRTTGILVTPAEFTALCRTGIAGVKDGSHNVGWLMEVQSRLQESGLDADIIPGTGAALLYGALYETNAVMSGTAVVFPRLPVEALQAMQRGDTETATALHRLIMAIRRAIARYGMPPAVTYHVLQAMGGMDLGVPRAPWSSLQDDQLSALVDELKGLPGICHYHETGP